MQKSERAYFINFPKRQKDEDLQGHLQQWQQLRIKYGAGLPEDHLIQMFQDILPDHVSKDVRDRRELVTLTAQLNWVNSELSRYNDSRLSKWNMMKLQHQLKPRDLKMPTSVNQVMAEDGRNSNVDATSMPAGVTQPPIPSAGDMQANLERMIAAAVSKLDRGRGGNNGGRPRSTGDNGSRSRSTTPSRRGNIPNPRFEGCWCCGKQGHSRKTCPEFKAIRDKNGGKVPKDYVGAYEKSLKAKKTSAAALAVSNVSDEPVSEFDETYLWPLITAKGEVKRPARATTSIKNRFDVFGV